MSNTLLLFLLLSALFSYYSNADVDEASHLNNATAVHHHHHKLNGSKEESEYCRRPWPKICIYLPLGLIHKDPHPAKIFAWREYMLRSLLLFWPIAKANTSLTFVLDEEMEHSHLLHDNFLKPIHQIQHSYHSQPEIKSQFPHFSYHFHRHPNPAAWNKTKNVVDFSILPYKSGYGRQQYLGFIPDLYTTAPYIAMVDDDTLFSTFIDREDLFENGKPVVHAQLKIMRGRNDFYATWAQNTWKILQKEMPMNCMSYFPVMFKREHFKELRDHLTSLHKMESFDDVFDKIFPHEFSDRYFSQFCILCTYLFWFRREEYAWRTHEKEPWWDGNRNPTPINGHYGDKSIYTAEEKQIKPMISSHAFYRDPARRMVIDNVHNLNAVLLQGICCNPHRTIQFHGLNCSVFFDTHKYNDELFGFEGVQYDTLLGIADVLAAYNARMKRFEGCNLHYAQFQMHQWLPAFNYTSKDFDFMVALNLKVK